MLKTLQKILAILAIVIAGYALIFQNYEVIPYMMFSLGAMTLVMGINEIKEERKQSGILIVVSSIFAFFVAIYSFLN